MATVHFILQKKGGAGKSLVSAMWFQFLEVKGYNVFGMDTDPSNQTFASYSELNITKLDIAVPDKGNKAKPRRV